MSRDGNLQEICVAHKKATDFIENLCLFMVANRGKICSPGIWLKLGLIALSGDNWREYNRWLKQTLVIPANISKLANLHTMFFFVDVIKIVEGNSIRLVELKNAVAERQLSSGKWLSTEDDSEEHIATTCYGVNLLLDDYTNFYGADVPKAGKRIMEFLSKSNYYELEWKTALALNTLSRLCSIGVISVDNWRSLSSPALIALKQGQLNDGGFRYFLHKTPSLEGYEPQSGLIETSTVLESLCTLRIPVSVSEIKLLQTLTNSAATYIVSKQRKAGDWYTQGIIAYLSTLISCTRGLYTYTKKI